MRQVILAIFVLFSLPVWAFSTSDIEQYYLHPDLYEAKTMLQSLSDQNFLDKNPASIPLISGFVGGLMTKRRTLIGQFRQMPLSVSMKKLTERVNKNMADAGYRLKPYLNMRQIKTPENLDTLWGLFYATGDARIPETIQNYIIEKCQNLSEAEIDMTSLMALSSLQENAKYHPLARLALRRTLQSASVQRKLSLIQNFSEIDGKI
ncbi:MAG: hypothetical protein IKS41_03035 [Alphaproteobacteria bacterium]|nr:hypothetical protein [Alphaproteobacteria bacterium]